MNFKDIPNKNVLVVDPTHGGLILAKKLRDFGANPEVWDIYKTLDCKKEIDGIRIIKDFSISENKSKYDIIFSPVHSPVLNPILFENSDQKIVTHHEIAGILLKEMLDKKTKVIEVTGLKAKTSTANILKEILIEAENKVLASTSLETVYENSEEKLNLGRPSITPANAILVLEKAIDQKLDFGIFLFETSLGFTGLAKTNILTSIDDDYDYMIARGKLTAINAKIFTIRNLDEDGKLILEFESYERNAKKISNKNITTYGFNKKADYSTTTPNNGFSQIKIENKKLNFNVVLSEKLFGKVHVKNALSAITAALSLDIGLDYIKSSLKKSTGVPYRMQRLKRGDQVIIDNSNPTLNPISLDMAIKEVLCYAKKCEYKESDITVVVGGKKSYCMKTDYLGLRDVINNYKLTFFLKGEIGRELKDIGSNGIYDRDPKPKAKVVLFSVQKKE